MASRKVAAFEVETMSIDEAEEKLNELRSSLYRGRASKYRPLMDKVIDSVDKDNVLKVTMSKTEVGGFRGYLSKHQGDKYVVKSSKAIGSDDEYIVFVYKT